MVLYILLILSTFVVESHSACDPGKVDGSCMKVKEEQFQIRGVNVQPMMQYLLNGFDLRRKQTSDSKLHYIPPSEEAETTTKSTRSKIVDSELKRSKAVAKGSKTLEYNLDPIDSFERAVVGDEFETLPALSFTAETEGQRKNLRRAFPEPLPAAQPRQRQVPPASIPLPASIAKQTREAILQYPSRTPPLLAKLNSPPVNSLPVQPNGIYAPAHHPVPPPRPPPPIVVAPSVPIRTTTTMHLTPPTTPRTTLVAAITTRRLAPAYPTTKYAVAPFSLNTVPPITTTRLINEYVQPNATLNGYATISPKSQKILDRLMQGGTDKTRVIDFAGKGETRYVAESVNEISGKPDSIDTDLGGNLEKEEVSLRDTSDRRRKSKKRKRVEDDEDGEDAEDDEDDDDNEKDEDDEDDDDDDENEEYDEDEYTSGYNEGYGVEPKDVGRKNQNLKDKILPIPRPPPGNNYNSRPPPVNTYPSRPPPGNAYPSRPPTGNNYPSRPSSENAYPPGPSTQNSYPEGPPANGLYQTQPPRYDEDGNNEDSYAEAPESVEEIDPEVKKKLKKTKGFLTNGKKKTTPKPKTGKKKTNKDGETEEDYENIDPDDLGDGLDLEDYDGSEDEQTPALRKKGKAKGKKEKKKQPEKKKGKKKEKLKGRKKQKKLNIENEDEEVEEDEYVEEEVEDVEEEIGDEDEEEKQDGEDDEDENKEDEESSLEQPSRRKGKKDKKLGKALKIKKIKPNDVNKKEKKEKKSEKTKKKDKKDKKEKKEKKVKKDKKDKNDKAEKKEKPKKKKGGPAPEEQEEPDDSPRHIVTDDDDIDDEFSNEEDSEEIELREKEDFETPPPLLEKPEPGEKSHIDRNVKTPYSDQKPSKFYYPPKSEVPLPTCFHNPSGYVCCNLMLNNLVEESVEEVKADPDFNMCNIGKIANMIQSKSEEMFEHPFESVVALGDFAQTVHFAGDLVCKLEIDGKYMLVYGTPYDADSIEDQKAIEDGDVKEDSAKKRVRRKKSLPIHSLRM